MSNIPNELAIRADNLIDYTEAEYDDYKYTYEDVIKSNVKPLPLCGGCK